MSVRNNRNGFQPDSTESGFFVPSRVGYALERAVKINLTQTPTSGYAQVD